MKKNDLKVQEIKKLITCKRCKEYCVLNYKDICHECLDVLIKFDGEEIVQMFKHYVFEFIKKYKIEEDYARKLWALVRFVKKNLS